MTNINEFTTNYLTQVIVEVDGEENNYGRLRTFVTESGFKFAADVTAYGDLVEFFQMDSMSMEAFDGEANFDLLITVGDQGDVGTFRLFVADTEQLDKFCRLISSLSGEAVHVNIASSGIALSTYSPSETVEQSPEGQASLSAEGPHSWPREVMDYDKAMTLLSQCTRDELRDHAFNDREITWHNGFGHEVATGYVGRGQATVSMTGFDIKFGESDARPMINLGTLRNVERNDENGPDTYTDA